MMNPATSLCRSNVESATLRRTSSSPPIARPTATPKANNASKTVGTLTSRNFSNSCDSSAVSVLGTIHRHIRGQSSPERYFALDRRRLVASAREILLVALGGLGQLRVGVELGLHLLPRCLALGRVELRRPVPLVWPVLLQDAAGDRRLVHLVDAVGDAHGRRRGIHRLDRSEVGGAQRAEDVQS